MKKQIEKIIDKYLPKKYTFNVYVNEQERKELFEDIEKLVLDKEKDFLGFWVGGMEAVECDECGCKGTGKSFEQAFEEYKNRIEK